MRRDIRSGGVKLPRIQRLSKGGRVYKWHRPTRTRLPDLPETHPEFIAAWAQAEASIGGKKTRAAQGTLASICEAVKADSTFGRLSPAYRRAIVRHMDAIIDAYGQAKASGLRPRHIEADLDKMEGSLIKARLKTWRMIGKKAKRLGLAEEDFAATIKASYTPGAGHHPWSAADIEKFRTHHAIDTPARLAMELLFWTGARVSDAVRMSPAMVGPDGVLSYRQQKTGGMAYIPWTAALPDYALPNEQDRKHLFEAINAREPTFTFLETATGRGRSVKGCSNLISNAARDAGLESRTAHGLRKSRLTAIAEGGGSAHAIMAWGGHASLSEAEHYTKSAARRSLVTGTEHKQNAVNSDQ